MTKKPWRCIARIACCFYEQNTPSVLGFQPKVSIYARTLQLYASVQLINLALDLAI